MKAIDTKSLLLGAGMVLLILITTSGKQINNSNNLEVFARYAALDVYNKETRTIYEYDTKLHGVKEKPSVTIKLSEDGSSLTVTKN